VLIGTARGCVETTERILRTLWGNPAPASTVGPDIPSNLSRVSPFATSHSAPACPSSAVSIKLDCKGPTFGLTAACSSSAHAIGLAARLIQCGMADAAVAGGTEACVTPSYAAMVHRSGILTPEVCRPFDRRRNGTLLGEGAGILILEGWEHARARGARVRAELLGYGASNDAESLYAPAPGGDPLAAAMLQAMREASVGPGEIGYIKAHGTATVKGDLSEANAIRAVLGGAAGRVPIGSLKPVLGHTIGASTAMEATLVIEALGTGWLPPTGNLKEPDPAIRLELLRGAPVRMGRGVAMVNSAGFGGTNACLIFGVPADHDRIQV
jgi:3-oxoacyl-(acyl-carrier-protein) synthase